MSAAAQFSKTRLSLGIFFLGHIQDDDKYSQPIFVTFCFYLSWPFSLFFSLFFKSNITEFINVRWRKTLFSIIEKLCWNFTCHWCYSKEGHEFNKPQIAHKSWKWQKCFVLFVRRSLESLLDYRVVVSSKYCVRTVLHWDLDLVFGDVWKLGKCSINRANKNIEIV